MQTCPNCKTEYPDGETVCPNCGVRNDFDPALLVSISNGMDAGMAGELLRKAGIPYYEKLRESGEYLQIVMGRSTAFDTELYVSRDDVPRAMEVVGFLGDQEPFDEQELEKAVDEYPGGPEPVERKNSGSYKTFLLFLAVFAVFVLAVILLRALS